MSQLPDQILIRVFREAIAENQSVGSTLCRVNRSFADLVRPILYENVRLYGTTAMLDFNELMMEKTNLRYMKLVRSLLVEQIPARFWKDPLFYFNERSMSKAWDRLCHSIWRLVQDHQLSSLALTVESCEYLCRSDYLSDQIDMGGMRLALDHLVVGRADDLKFLLRAFRPKRLTVYGCSHDMQKLSMSLTSTLRANRWIEEVNLMAGSDVIYVDWTVKDEEEFCEDLEFGDVDDDDYGRCTSVVSLDLLKLVKSRKIDLNVLFHRKESEYTVQRLESQLQNGAWKAYKGVIRIGEWGRKSDTSQDEAESASLTDGEWNVKDHRRGVNQCRVPPLTTPIVGKGKNKDRLSATSSKQNSERKKALEEIKAQVFLRCTCTMRFGAARP
ncbi:hypothetical protein CBS101457_006046 [Exobasidium rhododendri]|nr:hypothetical protein CBS101457_006046 [Exobasidium rhododendri]